MIDTSIAFVTDNKNYKKMMNIINEFYFYPTLQLGTEKHHIIPKSYFKKLGIKVDNSSENIVVLPFYEHMLVHYYAAQCAKPIIKDAMLRAMNNFFKVKDIDEDFILKHRKEFDKAKKSVTRSEDMKKKVLNDWIEWAKHNKPEDYQKYLENKYKKEHREELKQLRHIKTLEKQKELIIKQKLENLEKKFLKELEEKNKRIEIQKRLEKRKIICVETGEIFNTGKDVSLRFNYSQQNINRWIRGLVLPDETKKYHFQYLDKKLREEAEQRLRKKHPK